MTYVAERSAPTPGSSWVGTLGEEHVDLRYDGVTTRLGADGEVLPGRYFVAREPVGEPEDFVIVVAVALTDAIDNQSFPVLHVQTTQFGYVPESWYAATIAVEPKSFYDTYRLATDDDMAKLAADDLVRVKKADAEAAKKAKANPGPPWRRG